MLRFTTRTALGRLPAAADPALLGLGLFDLLLVPYFLTGAGGSLSSWLVQVVFDVLNVLLAVRLCRLPGAGRQTRRFWITVVVALAFSAAGDTLQTGLVVAGNGERISPVQTGLVVAGMIVVLIAMLFHPLGGTGRQRLRMWLDAATVLSAVAVFLWYYLLAGQLSDGRSGDRLGAAVTAAAMLLVTFALLKLVFSETSPFTRTAGTIGAIGVAGTAVAAPVTSMLIGEGGTGVLLLAQLVPCMLLPISFRLQDLQTRRRRGKREGGSKRGFSKLPYVAVAALQALLIAALPAADPDARIWGVVIGVVLITALVLIRQVAAFQDNERLLTELDVSMTQLRDQKEWFSALVQHASDLTVVTSAGGTIRYASPAADRVLGSALLGDPLPGRVHPDDLPVLRALTERLAAAPGTDGDAEIRLRHSDGSYRWLHLIGTDLRGNQSVAGVVWNGRDITDARRLQDQLRHQASHDALTGLANRTLLEQRLREMAPDRRIAVLLLDLDGFKQINDVHGHHAGDQVLVAAGTRMTTLLGGEAMVVRLGGDEFVVLIPDAGPDRAAVLADRIAAAIAEPIDVTGAVVAVGASIGVAAGTASDADHLLRDADAAMYVSKQDRRTASPA